MYACACPFLLLYLCAVFLCVVVVYAVILLLCVVFVLCCDCVLYTLLLDELSFFVACVVTAMC